MRRAGDVVVIACRGTIAGGADAGALQRQIEQLLPLEPHIVLNGAEVTFLDSAGVGMLVRMLHKTRGASGDLKLCGLSRRASEVLRITRLAGVFDVHTSEDEAIAAFYARSSAADAPQPAGGDILCIDHSPDLLAFICGVLRTAGYRVLPCGNVSDAAVLLKVSSARAVIAGPGVRAHLDSVRGASPGAGKSIAVLELPPGFGSRDPRETSRELLSLAHALVGEPA